jgi:imidazolonepropionase-like amidohydrolase
MFSCTPGDAPAPAGHVGCLCHRPEIQALSRRLTVDLSRRGFVAGLTASAAALGLPAPVKAQPGPGRPSGPILITNVSVFDGRSSDLRGGARVLVEGPIIRTVADASLKTDGAVVVDGGGRVLMPGLIDAHWHCMFAALPLAALMSRDLGYVHLAAAAEAERTLMRGFTTVRDLGGPAFALKEAIDEGLMPGPRIYPSGAMITTSGGHGDLRPLSDLPRSPGGPVSANERTGSSMIADGPDEVRMRAREQLLQAASQVKLVGSGGVSSPRSPLDMTTFSEAALRAGIETAADWGTYATVHAYMGPAINRALAAGAKCIEHGHLMDEATARAIAERGAWLSIQPFVGDEDSVPLTGASRVKLLQVIAGTDRAYRLAKAAGIKTAFGSDLLFSGELTARQGAMLTHLTRWYAAPDILKMATSANAELLALSGPRNPYPGKLGVIEEGALADLLIVDGNPLETIALLADPDRNLALIMKAGRIVKNSITV